ncbi:MAG TPA: RNA polymerase sigma factor [Pyrinomonadaceae bacterium]|nr:RNA polymerase sigma factor [Pyrinomonadaceae bacterium]
MDDAHAIEKCQNGETDAFRYLVERYQKQAVGHAIAILGVREDALDAVQDAFIDAFRSLRSFDRARNFYPWFYVLLRNRCYKSTARRRTTESIEMVEILAPQAQVASEELFGLQRALLSLTQEDREIVTLKYLDGLSYEELAHSLKIPKGTVMSRLFYARKKLQTLLSGNTN